MTQTADTHTDPGTIRVSQNTDSAPVKNIFGTDGIRGAVGTAPFTIEYLARLGYALGLWARKKYGASPSLLIAHDTRLSCSFIQAALESGLLLHSVDIFNAGVLPTPVVHYAVRTTKKYSCGIMISASHNPYHDNGLKIIDSQHGKLTLEDELAISSLYATATTLPAAYDKLGTTTQIAPTDTAYADYVQASFGANFLQGRTIVLDCAHGATYRLAPALFKQCGARVITINDQPNGKNINEQSGSLHTQSLKKAVLDNNADAGFAFDGDGDRVIAVNRHGQEKNGDDILAILLQHPQYVHTAIVVGTLMTNQGFEKQLEKQYKQLIRAHVGDKHVWQELEKYNLLLGGEQSGHIIMRDFLESGDGIGTALKIAQTLCLTGNWDMDSYTPYPQILLTIPVAHKHDLTTPRIVRIIEQQKQLLVSGRVLIRYSGTESSLRIMVEDETIENATMVAQRLATELDAALKN
ncbi:MAG: phosphoglucosamine mutase [Epsilonproteobacteria bacterium]|nr:phosphoglucosamine mutase [Campylobacterota bacterium]